MQTNPTTSSNLCTQPPLSFEEKLRIRLESFQLAQTPKTASLNDESSRDWIAKNMALIGIPSKMLDVCVEILEYMGNMKVVWIHLQECTGCSESLLRTETPSFDVLMLEIFKLHYHDLTLAASGYGAQKILEDLDKEKFVLCIEGSVSMGDQEEYITLGGKSGYQEISHLIKKAEAVFAVGTCSSYGGIQTAYPNPTNGFGIQEVFKREIIHIPGCPPSDKNIIGSLTYFFLLNESPTLDALGRPLWAYSKSVHDLCERRNFFLSGDFVQSFDDPNMAKGYCLYKVGCKGPYTFNNCPKVKFNAKTSWPVQAGHGCIGCSEPNFWDNFGLIEKPLGNANFTTFNPRCVPEQNIAPIKLESKPNKEALHKHPNLEKFAKNGICVVDWNDEFKLYLLNAESTTQTESIDSANQVAPAVLELGLTPFEANPKCLLNALESKSKQTKRLFENYTHECQKAYATLLQLKDASLQSTRIDILLGSMYALLEGIKDEADVCDIAKLAPHLIAQAETFAYPYVSPLGFKYKQNDQNLSIDMTKALNNILAYKIGGLDTFGVCFSILSDLGLALGEYLIKANKDGAIVLCGTIFENRVFLKGVLKGLGGKNLQGRIYVC